MSGLTRYFNACIKEVSQTALLSIHHKLYNNKKDILDKGLEDRSQLLDEINFIVRDATVTSTKKTP